MIKRLCIDHKVKSPPSTQSHCGRVSNMVVLCISSFYTLTFGGHRHPTSRLTLTEGQALLTCHLYPTFSSVLIYWKKTISENWAEIFCIPWLGISLDNKFMETGHSNPPKNTCLDLWRQENIFHHKGQFSKIWGARNYHAWIDTFAILPYFIISDPPEYSSLNDLPQIQLSEWMKMRNNMDPPQEPLAHYLE